MERYNQLPTLAAGVELNDKLKQATEILVARCLGEPHNFHAIAAHVLPVMVEQMHPNQRSIMSAILGKYAEEKKYSALSIATLSATPYDALLILSGEYTEATLEEAWQNYFDTYSRVMAIAIMEQEKYEITKGIDTTEARVKADKERDRMGLNVMSGSVGDDGKVEFERVLIDAIDGKEPDYPVKPFLANMRKFIPFYEPKDFIVVGGRSGMGKSYYALNQLLFNAQNKVPTLYINLEMSSVTVYKRLWQMRCGVAFNYNMSKSSPNEIQKYMQEWEWIKNSCIHEVNHGRELNSTISAIRQAYYKHGIMCVMVDYIQLCKESHGSKIRTYELESIVYGIKEACGLLGLPCFALAQLGRQLVVSFHYCILGFSMSSFKMSMYGLLNIRLKYR